MKLNIFPKISSRKQTRKATIFSETDALKIAKKLKIDFNKVKFTLADFKNGMNVELEHGKANKKTNVTNDNPLLTGKITLTHLNEFPDYYERLEKLEAEADKFWQNKSKTKEYI